MVVDFKINEVCESLKRESKINDIKFVFECNNSTEEVYCFLAVNETEYDGYYFLDEDGNVGIFATRNIFKAQEIASEYAQEIEKVFNIKPSYDIIFENYNKNWYK